MFFYLVSDIKTFNQIVLFNLSDLSLSLFSCVQNTTQEEEKSWWWSSKYVFSGLVTSNINWKMCRNANS